MIPAVNLAQGESAILTPDFGEIVTKGNARK
jgi:hypothetical protein